MRQGSKRDRVETMEDGEIEEEGMMIDGNGEDAQLTSSRKLEKSAYEMLRESKSSIEEIVAEMVAIKREKQPKAQLRELVTQMFIHFVTLRQVISKSLFHTQGFAFNNF